VCILTARAVNSDGLTTTIRAAVLARAGSEATALPPSASAFIFGQTSACFLRNTTPPPTCGPFHAGEQVTLDYTVRLFDGLPGAVTVTDSCAGPQPAGDSFFFSSNVIWQIPDAPGTTCTTTFRATTLQGSSSELAVQYLIDP
jgi:hypothetical protein